MKHEEVVPHIRRWVEVYLDSDGTSPSYRGVLLWHEVGESVVIHALKGEIDALPTPARQPLAIMAIREIVSLKDPEQLDDSNKSATYLRAKRIAEDG